MLDSLTRPVTLSFELAALHLVALALFVLLVLAWGRHGRRRILVASAVMTVSAIVLTYVATVRPNNIAIDWITILSHGLGGKSIMHLYARGLNVGASFGFVVGAVAAGTVPNLHDVVWLNLLLALINAAIFFHVAVHVVGLVWALPWTLAFGLNPAMFMASFSELPTQLLALYFSTALIAWAVAVDALPQPRVMRGAAYVLCAVLTLLAGLTRSEVALIGGVALALHAAHALLGPESWSAATQRLRDACRQPLVFLDDHPAAVVVLCVVGIWLSLAGLPWGLAGRSESGGLYPFNPSILSLLAYLPMLLLPIGVSIAVLLGFIHAIVHFRRFGGLALSLFILVRVYFAAWSQYFEMARYLSHILPAIFLLGLFGKEQLDQMERRWRPHWGRAARIGYLMAWFTLPLPGILEQYARPEYQPGGGFSQLLLDLNTQREVRHLVALTENNPQCVFVARVVEDRADRLAGPEHHGDPKTATEYVYVFFGAPLSEPVLVSEKEMRLDDAIARYASGASCVRLYYGGDCNLTFTDRCTEFVAGRRLVEEQRFWSRPYNNPLQSGYGAPEIVLATYEWTPGGAGR